MAGRILITGANGFIGRHLVSLATSKGFSVTALILPGTDRSGIGKASILESPPPFDKAVEAALERQDTVVNLAGNMLGADPCRYRAANVETVSTLAGLLERMAVPPRLIHVSSVSAIGPSPLDGSGNPVPLAENAFPEPICLYGKSKRAGEKALHSTLRRTKAVVLRPCSVFGPGDRSFLGLFDLARKGVFLKMGTRAKRFQMIFAPDLAEAILGVAQSPSVEGIFNIGNPKVLSDDDFSLALETASGKPLRAVFLPPGVLSLAGKLYDLLEIGTSVPRLMSSNKALEMRRPDWLQDFSKFLDKFPGTRFTPFPEAVERTFRWYSDHSWI